MQNTNFDSRSFAADAVSIRSAASDLVSQVSAASNTNLKFLKYKGEKESERPLHNSLERVIEED